MRLLKLAASAQLLLITLLIIVSAPFPVTTSSLPSVTQQSSFTGKYVTTFRLAASNLSLSPVIIYPTSTVVWVFAQVIGSNHSQILAFTEKPQPTFKVDVSLTNISASSSIAVDPQNGRVWYGAGKMLAYYDPSTSTNQTVASFSGGRLGYLTVDSRSRVWVTLTGANSIGVYDSAKPGNVTYRVPTSIAGLQGITATAPDGDIWFAEASVRKLGRLNPDTSGITEYTAPVDVAAPTQLVVDSKGVVWYSDHASSDFGSFNPATGEWRKIPVGYCIGDCAIALPNAIALDTTGKVWFSEHLRGVIGDYDSASNLLVEYTIPPPVANTLQFPATWWTWPGPGNLVWFADLSYREIGYVNASVPVPLAMTSENALSAFQGEQGSIPVTVNYQGTGQILLGVSTSSFDMRNSQITGSNQPLTAAAYPAQASARFSVAWNANLESRYVTVTVQDGQVALSVPIRISVRTAYWIYWTIGAALIAAGTFGFLYTRSRRRLKNSLSFGTFENTRGVPEIQCIMPRLLPPKAKPPLVLRSRN